MRAQWGLKQITMPDKWAVLVSSCLVLRVVAVVGGPILRPLYGGPGALQDSVTGFPGHPLSLAN